MPLLEIEAQHRGIFAAAARIGELADHRAIGRHEGGVARVDLIGVVSCRRGRKWHGDARLLIGVHHLAVLAHRHLLVELVARRSVSRTSDDQAAFSIPIQRKLSTGPSSTSFSLPVSDFITQSVMRGVPPPSTRARNGTGPAACPSPALLFAISRSPVGWFFVAARLVGKKTASTMPPQRAGYVDAVGAGAETIDYQSGRPALRRPSRTMSNDAGFLIGSRCRAPDTVNPGDSDRSLASAARASARRSSWT